MSLPTSSDMEKLRGYKEIIQYSNLFLETNKNDKLEPLFTLRTRMYKGYPSAYQIYMESVSEYDAALKICPSYLDWEKLCRLSWFMTGKIPSTTVHAGLITWRQHMKARDASNAKAVLLQKMDMGDTGAAKAILAETKEVPKKAGRPSAKVDPIAVSILKRAKTLRSVK